MKSAFLNCTCEGKDGIQMFLSFARGSWGTHRCQIDVWERSDSCFAASLFPQQRCGLSCTSAPSCLCRLSSLRDRRMCILVRTPRSQDCSPVLLTFC